jgi:hypothetical protein
MRIDDDTWENAKKVAEFHDTSVSALVIAFLKRLRIANDPMVTAKRSAKAVNPKQSTPAHLNPNFEFFKPTPHAECEHKQLKTIKFGSFCVTCGKKVS